MSADDLGARLAAALGPGHELLGELGGGGMSRVFLVHDRELDRRLVAKVLPPGVAQALEADRFRREIRVAAQLQHPNVVPLLSAGEVEGLPWYLMPYVAGDTLRANLDRIETWLIRRALDQHGQRRSATARKLGITREGLYK